VSERTLGPDVLATMRCPTCGEGYEATASGVRCGRGHELAWQHDVLMAPIDQLPEDARKTVEGFGYEWTAFPGILPEDEPFWERYSRDLDLGALGDAVAIDVGCGKGRFSWFLAPAVRHLVAFDASDSAFVAARNLADRPNTTAVRADLHEAPFADGAFDLVSCIGVLHYVPDPAKGFDEVVRLVAPGGTLLLSVYSRPEHAGVRKWALDAATAVRRVTPRVPRPLLRALSAPVGALLYATFVLPGRLGERIGNRALASLPLQTYRGRPLRSLWLDTFNRLHAPFEHRFVRAEVDGWLAGAGLEVLHIREDAGWMVVARRPQPSPSEA